MKMTLIKQPARTVWIFDGVIYHHMVFNPSRLNARHGDRTQTNLGFLDGHVETWQTKNLPGGIGSPTPADVSLAAIQANYPNSPLIWYLEQK
jgi:prepilin-type processing-associated H-X9-DG protein